MKNMCKIIILSILFILPIYTKADTYNNEVNTTNEYILRSDYINDYQRYLIDGKNKTIPFGFSRGKIENVSEFKMGGFLSKDEYMITSNNTLTDSYLFDGIKYWTLTSDGSKKYVVGDSSSKDTSEIYRNKTTEYILTDTRVTGKGTLKDPWVFEPIYKVELNAEHGKVNYSEGQYVGRNNKLHIGVTPDVGYRYITNDCGVYLESYSANNATISSVNRDISCNIIFGLGVYKLKLEESDVSPKEFYLRYNEDFYRDSDAQITFRKLDKNPEKTGYTFKGYEYTDKNGTKTKIIDENGTVDKSKSGVITEEATLKVIWEANKYTVTFNANGGTVSQSTLEVTYDSPYGTMPSPTYSGYGFDGWYTASSGGTKITNTTEMTTPRDHILYAHWTKCAAGTYSDGTTALCQACPAGSYCTGGSAKAGCPGGTYRTTTGAKSAGECTKCGANTYSSVVGANYNSCQACSTGYLSGEGATACNPKVLTVTFYKNDGSSTTATNSFTYGVSNQKFNGTPTTWSRTNYTFLGWSTSSGATSATYSVSNAVTDAWINSNYPSIKLYAIWKLNLVDCSTGKYDCSDWWGKCGASSKAQCVSSCQPCTYYTGGYCHCWVEQYCCPSGTSESGGSCWLYNQTSCPSGYTTHTK